MRLQQTNSFGFRVPYLTLTTSGQGTLLSEQKLHYTYRMFQGNSQLMFITACSIVIDLDNIFSAFPDMMTWLSNCVLLGSVMTRSVNGTLVDDGTKPVLFFTVNLTISQGDFIVHKLTKRDFYIQHYFYNNRVHFLVVIFIKHNDFQPPAPS